MYRISLSLFSLITSVSLALTAMDHVCISKVLYRDDPRKSTCHLTRLPADIRSYIAFLAFEHESEEEFVERTQTQEKVANVYYENFTCGQRSRGYSVVYCPYKINIALLELLRGTNEPKITIIDLLQNHLYSETLNQMTSYTAVAVSRYAAMFATIRQTTFGYRGTGNNNGSVLEVKNIRTQKIQEFDIPDYFPKTNLISFNKQGTRVIVYAPADSDLVKCNATGNNSASISFVKINPTAPKVIFNLKTEGRMTSEKSLEKYFRELTVCNNLVSTLPV